MAAHPDVRLPVDEDVRLRARLREAAKVAKVALTTANEYRIVLTDLAVAAGSSLGLDVALTTRYGGAHQRENGRTLELVDKALNMAGYQADDLSQVLLVGGQTRTPIIKDALGKAPEMPGERQRSPEERSRGAAAVLGADCAAISEAGSRCGMPIPSLSGHRNGRRRDGGHHPPERADPHRALAQGFHQPEGRAEADPLQGLAGGAAAGGAERLLWVRSSCP